MIAMNVITSVITISWLIYDLIKKKTCLKHLGGNGVINMQFYKINLI